MANELFNQLLNRHINEQAQPRYYGGSGFNDGLKPATPSFQYNRGQFPSFGFGRPFSPKPYNGAPNFGAPYRDLPNQVSPIFNPNQGYGTPFRPQQDPIQPVPPNQGFMGQPQKPGYRFGGEIDPNQFLNNSKKVNQF